MQKTVVTILSSNFSGSHFLSLILGSHSKAMHIGEIKHLRRVHKSELRYCYVCEDPERCPVLSGITPETIDSAYETIFSNINDPNIITLIDASKKVSWAKRFIHHNKYEMKYIHLIRDPRALVRRWIISDATWRKRGKIRIKLARSEPPKSWPLLWLPIIQVYTYRWLFQNREISRFISENKLDALLVTYWDLANYSEREVQRVTKWLGLTYEPSQLDYWNFEHHGTQKATYEWTKKQKTRYFDKRWQVFFTKKQQEEIIGHRDVVVYLDNLGLVATDEGLTLRSNISLVESFNRTNKLTLAT